MLIRLRSFYLSGQRVLSLDLIISIPLYKWGPQAQDLERSCLVNKRLHVAQESVAERHIKEIQDNNLSYYLNQLNRCLHLQPPCSFWPCSTYLLNPINLMHVILNCIYYSLQIWLWIQQEL